ncbi:hypothetical protein KP509_32G055500 [Ceratopteris richardii]|uniref:CCHC-type domain-containing protein n=1 Tax=Ceratopteris richardii TaxID=49495 RepID=A0A8T2QTI4_CERRI|nr:hypothetical protein KP509_32G055500 [Ceratopteris richardii]
MPEKFDGQVKLYIYMEPDRYLDKASKVRFIGTLLYGQALSWFAPTLEKNIALLQDYEGFLRELTATFGDEDSSRPLTPQGKQRRRANKLCLYCGNLGHIAVNCPNKRTNSRVVATLVENITMETTPLRVHLGDHESHICFNVISSPIHLVIIGML